MVTARPWISLLLVVATVTAAALALTHHTDDVPLQADALEQYFYARSKWFEPAFKKHGDERQTLLRQAIVGLQAVIHRFPERPAVTTRALAQYDCGVCYRALGETWRAREAFLRVRDYRRYFMPGVSMHTAGRDTLRVIVDAADARIRELAR